MKAETWAEIGMTMLLGLACVALLSQTPTLIQSLTMGGEPPADVSTVDYSLPPWERIPQATVNEVTGFATDFFAHLGYRLAGQVQCVSWQLDSADHQQWTCYGVVDPTRAPQVVVCGSRQRAAVWPLGCTFVQPPAE